EEALFIIFERGLKLHVMDELYKENRPDTLQEYIVMAIRIDNKFFSYHKGTGGQTNQGRKRRTSTTAHITHAGPMHSDTGTGCEERGLVGLIM
ncbi:hypothetical protein B0T25DRAFT_458202, partial [Lasiosphaeria hispida]